MILKGVLFLAACWIVLTALAWFFQRKLIYLPLIHSTPRAADHLAGAEDVTCVTEDGLVLGGWFAHPSGRGPGSAPAVTALVFNGNAGNRSFRAPLARALVSEGIAVMLTDYRGYGGNPGSPSEAGLLADARAAREYLDGRPDVDPERIVYFGESLGAAVAVALAAERPPAALILRSPFCSMTDMGRHHYPFLPVSLLLWDRYPSLERIRGVRCPLLVIAGERDRIIPASESERLYEAAPGPKRLVLIPGADHNDADLLDGERFIDEIVMFIREVGE